MLSNVFSDLVNDRDLTSYEWLVTTFAEGSLPRFQPMASFVEGIAQIDLGNGSTVSVTNGLLLKHLSKGPLDVAVPLLITLCRQYDFWLETDKLLVDYASRLTGFDIPLLPFTITSSYIETEFEPGIRKKGKTFRLVKDRTSGATKLQLRFTKRLRSVLLNYLKQTALK